MNNADNDQKGEGGGRLFYKKSINFSEGDQIST